MIATRELIMMVTMMTMMSNKCSHVGDHVEQATSSAPSHLGAAQGARVHREDGQVRSMMMMMMMMMMVAIYKIIKMESIVYILNLLKQSRNG